MLVLSRKKHEAVIITVGDQRIRVMPVDIRGDKVRLGFAAPKDVTIHREEIQGEIDAERLGDINYDPTIGEDYA
jgi:carbon storage regulator